MNDDERLELLEKTLEDLRHLADGATLVVEGVRDLQALERLGIGGHHVAVQRGKPLSDVADALVIANRLAILLLDWDRSGEKLAGRLRDLLQARLAFDLDFRRRIAVACHCRSFEEVPAELAALRRGDL